LEISLSQLSDLRKTFEVIYVPPANGDGGTAPGKSLSVHHFMRYARDRHKELLNHLSNENLLDGTGESSVIESESKTVIECTGKVIEKIRALPFVEQVTEAPAPRMYQSQHGR
jgi:predicted NodU family carbamoyl transferase